ncbi:MAG: flagellar type III secretion system protein FlhB [Sphingopyxis sp.]
MADFGEKTERPTDKRKRESAGKGDVIQSRELGIALVTGAALAWLTLTGKQSITALKLLMISGLTINAETIAHFDPVTAITALESLIVPMMLGLFGVTCAAAAGGAAMLGSLGFRAGAMRFQFSRINPYAGLKRMFGLQGIIELGKSVLKVVLLGAIGYWLVIAFVQKSPLLMRTDIEAGIGAAGQNIMVSLLIASGGLFVIALIDAPIQYFRRLKRLMMSRQEVKDEQRQSEGAPEQKSAMRRAQYAVLQNSARKAIAEASVVLTNPTHFAVALRYLPGKDAAPIVVARGRGAVAQAMRELAGKAAVPLLNYPELTRAIYFTSRTGSAIREDLYMAVATILGFIFNLDQQISEHVPDVVVPPGARFDAQGRPI